MMKWFYLNAFSWLFWTMSSGEGVEKLKYIVNCEWYLLDSLSWITLWNCSNTWVSPLHEDWHSTVLNSLCSGCEVWNQTDAAAGSESSCDAVPWDCSLIAESILESLLGTGLDFAECSFARSDNESLADDEETPLCLNCEATTPFDATGFTMGGFWTIVSDLGSCCLDSLIKSLNDGGLFPVNSSRATMGDSCPNGAFSSTDVPEGESLDAALSVASSGGVLLCFPQKGERAKLGLACNLTSSTKLTVFPSVLAILVVEYLLQSYLTKGNHPECEKLSDHWGNWEAQVLGEGVMCAWWVHEGERK